MDWLDFARMEAASRDCIDLKRSYIDVAGDLAAGVMLSQIIYYFLPAQAHYLRDGWLVRRRADWWEECRLTPKQADRALRLLIQKGLIETRIAHDAGGAPTTHVRLLKDSFLAQYESAIGRYACISTFGEYPYFPKGNMDIPLRAESSINKENICRRRDNDDDGDSISSMNDDILQLVRTVVPHPDPKLTKILSRYNPGQIQRAVSIVRQASHVKNPAALLTDVLLHPEQYVDHAAVARAEAQRRWEQIAAEMRRRREEADTMRREAVPPAKLGALLAQLKATRGETAMR